MNSRFTIILLLLILLSTSCRKDLERYENGELSGGRNGTVFDESKTAFLHQMPGVTGDAELQFFVGNSFFNQNWVSSPASTTARDGLGPLMNARSCSACHFKDGRGKPFLNSGDNANGFLIRLSISGIDEYGGPVGDPVYGDQFNDLAINESDYEGDIEVAFEYINGTYDDGEVYTLRKPIYSLTNLKYGPISSNIQMSPRIGQQMIGLGLLNAISESDLAVYVDDSDIDGDGISGKFNEVWDYKNDQTAIGRFGWKANQPNLYQQVAAALKGDLGIKSSLFPSENYTSMQPYLDTLADGGNIEIDDDDLLKMVMYSSSLAVPAKRNAGSPDVKRGEALFSQIECVKCHVNQYRTGNTNQLSYLNNQTIHPYTDLLLHDMGDELGDNRPDYLANGNEWRTQALWGIGLIEIVNGHTYLLHDGRARNIEEAILWHGGEAENAAAKFKALTKDERTCLIAFINAL